MATKADRFKAEQQREANPPKKSTKGARKRRDSPVDTAKKGVSATDRKVGAGKSGGRNVSKRVARKGGAKLEDSATGKASRKSTRKSASGAKPASTLRQRETRRVTSGKARATKAAAKTKTKAKMR